MNFALYEQAKCKVRARHDAGTVQITPLTKAFAFQGQNLVVAGRIVRVVPGRLFIRLSGLIFHLKGEKLRKAGNTRA